MITKPEISKQRRRIRHAVTRRDRVPFPPAWTIATDDVERPNTPELVRERGEVAPVEKRDVRRAARPSVVHAEALERKRLELQAQLDGLDAPLPHGRQARPVDIALGFPPEYPPRVIRQGTHTPLPLLGAGIVRHAAVCLMCLHRSNPLPLARSHVAGYKVTAPEIPLPPDVRAEVTMSNVPRKHPADAELLAKVLKNVQRFETQAAKDSAYVAAVQRPRPPYLAMVAYGAVARQPCPRVHARRLLRWQRDVSEGCSRTKLQRICPLTTGACAAGSQGHGGAGG